MSDTSSEKFSDFDDEAYSSPTDISENVDNIDELDFSEFIWVDDEAQNCTESHILENEVFTPKDISLWCSCDNCVAT